MALTSDKRLTLRWKTDHWLRHQGGFLLFIMEYMSLALTPGKLLALCEGVLAIGSDTKEAFNSLRWRTGQCLRHHEQLKLKSECSLSAVNISRGGRTEVAQFRVT